MTYFCLRMILIGAIRMNFKDLDIKASYISYGSQNIASCLINPALKYTKCYKRSVGFFSSSVFQTVLDGIDSLVKNEGKIMLIASPNISEEDKLAISIGYEERKRNIEEAFDRSFNESLAEFDDRSLNLLAELIAEGFMDIKLAVTKCDGIYHDKLGILEDIDGNAIVFYGSANSSKNAYVNNYEKIRVSRSWDAGELIHVEDEQKEFDSLWENQNEFLDVYDYNEAAKRNIIKTIESRSKNSSSTKIKLRDYQEEAIEAWVNNGYKGFYVMATGTGKTWTAIFSAKRLLETQDVITVICAPYKHLIKQWAEDVANAFDNSAKIILVSSENYNWETDIRHAISYKRYHPETQIIIISTIASFKLEKFKKAISKHTGEKLLIVDEAHRFKNRDENTKKTYKYMLGLSATPFSGKFAASGLELMKFFGGQVFNLPIEEALKRKFLVNYYYHPIFVYATAIEEQNFEKQTQRIISCFRNKRCINPDELVKALRARLRIISMAKEKIQNLESIIKNMHVKDHFIVYCGDGKLFDVPGDEQRHIDYVKKILTESKYRVSQFTASESMSERMNLVKAFNNGDISALVAIKCLDEGINIPSITDALILSSNDDYREFVQRRGRILRLYGDKQCAHIYDVIVLPSPELKGWAEIEFRRYREYARLAINAEALLEQLNNEIATYDINEEDLDVYDYENMEVEADE